MKTPNYTITNLILTYLIKYELSLADIRYHLLPDDLLEPLIEKYLAEDLENLGNLVGNPIGYNNALLIQRGSTSSLNRKKIKLFTNFRSAKEFISSYNNTNSLKPSVDLTSHINKLVVEDLVEEWDIAALRTFSEKPNDIYDTWYKYRDFYPQIEPGSYFAEIIDWIANGKDSNHKLIKTGVLLYEFIDKAPYTAGNQITSLLTIELLTKKYGYNPNNIFPFFRSIYDISSDLIYAFRLSKSQRDLTPFLEAYLYTISKTAVEISNEISAIYSKKVKKEGSRELELNQRQIQLLDYLSVNKKITRSKFTKMMGTSFMTSYRDIQNLIQKKYIKQKGKGRGTYYVLNDETRDEDLILDDIII